MLRIKRMQRSHCYAALFVEHDARAEIDAYRRGVVPGIDELVRGFPWKFLAHAAVQTGFVLTGFNVILPACTRPPCRRSGNRADDSTMNSDDGAVAGVL